MNVLHIDEQSAWRGGERQASWLIQGLVEHGHKVIIAGKSNCPFVTSDHAGAEILHRLEAPFLCELDLWTAWRLSKCVRKYSVDILHSHTSHSHSIACLTRAFAGRGKVVASRRVSFAQRQDPLNKWKYSAPDMFIAVSNRVSEVLIEGGVDRNKVCTVHSAIDPQRLEVEPLSRSTLGIAPDVPLLFNAGSLEEAKGHDVLLDAMAIIVKKRPDVKLLIAGEGPLRVSIESQISELGLCDSVKLLGHRQDVPAITRSCNLYVSSSNFEGLGTSVLEALVCAVPVVATLAGGAAEMISHEETGLLVPIKKPDELAGAVLRMLSDEETATKMAQQASIYVRKNFSVEKMVNDTIEVYEDLLQ